MNLRRGMKLSSRSGVCRVQYFICNNCDSIMDEIEATCLRQEVHTELDGHPTEWIWELRCIYCGSDDLEEAELCEKCDEYYPVSEMTDGLCKRCYERMME